MNPMNMMSVAAVNRTLQYSRLVYRGNGRCDIYNQMNNIRAPQTADGRKLSVDNRRFNKYCTSRSNAVCIIIY